MKQHAAFYASPGKQVLTADIKGALTQTCVVLFNILHAHTVLSQSFTPAIPFIFAIIKESQHANFDDELLVPVLHTLLCLDHTSPEWKASAWPSADETVIVTVVVDILSRKLSGLDKSAFEINIPPLLNVIHCLCQEAPQSVINFLQAHLLPNEEDHRQAIGKSSSLASKLVQFTSDMTSICGKCASVILFELSDSNANILIQNLGFGHASGILVAMGIAVPDQSNLPNASASGEAINPITGQFLSEEDPGKDLQEMTAEEKDREAERLFVLFERLNATGVMKVDPLREAVESGRFEEVDDDEDLKTEKVD
jgi:hypothetical protein